MAEPDDQYMDDIASENESIAKDEESNDVQSMNDIGSEYDPIANEEEPNASETELRSVYVSSEAENSSTTDLAPSSSGPGLLSLPPELRVLVFRHLLLIDRPLSTYWPHTLRAPFLAILDTSPLIRQEAFQIFYGENTFAISWLHPRYSILNNRRVADTIQNVQFDVHLNDPSPWWRQLNFVNVIRQFGSPAIARGTLTLIFSVESYENDWLTWFTRALPRFTNFHTLRIKFLDASPHGHLQGVCFLLAEAHQITFTHVFGPVVLFANNCGLEFHPRAFRDSRPPPEVHVDWMDFLDGIRLGWNQDPSEESGV